MFRNTVKVPPDLYDRAKRYAEMAGFRSVDEFVARAVEKELERRAGDTEDKSSSENK